MLDAPFHLPGKRRHRKLASPSEGEIHRAVVAHLRARAYPDVVWWHTPNDGKRSPATAKRLQAMGMLAGVADLVLVRAFRAYAMELKSASGRLTEAQQEFLARMDTAGAYTVVCHDVDSALRCLLAWNLIR